MPKRSRDVTFRCRVISFMSQKCQKSSNRRFLIPFTFRLPHKISKSQTLSPPQHLLTDKTTLEATTRYIFKFTRVALSSIFPYPSKIQTRNSQPSKWSVLKIATSSSTSSTRIQPLPTPNQPQPTPHHLS